MAIKLPRFLTATDTKSRLILVGVTIGIVAGLIFVVSKVLGSSQTTGAAHVANAPGGLQSVPGSQLSAEYYRAVMQANAQTAKQAQMTGGSAVPTMVNVPGQQAATTTCASACEPDVTDDINSLVRSGKFSQDDANKILDMAKNNVSVGDYAAQLDDLVKQGKLTPEQARKLLDEYKRQHANALVADNAKSIDALVKSGKMSVETASELLGLQKQGLTPAQYAAELNRLVREGKISPEMASQLLAEYTQQKAKEDQAENAANLRQMVKSGQITQDVADDLIGMQKNNVPVDQYKAELDRLVAAGKLTPAAAAKLLADYQKQHQGTGAGAEVSQAVATAEQAGNAEIDDMVAKGVMSKDAADQLKALRTQHVSPEDYKKALDDLVKAGKLSPDAAARLMATYQKEAKLRDEAARLQALQGRNASPTEYADELKRAVAASVLTPEAAAQLLQQYQASVTRVTPLTDESQNQSANASKLQERIESQQGLLSTGAQPAATTNAGATGPADQQFAAAISQADAEAAQKRAQHIQELMGAMSGQAQSLIASWAPPVMRFQGGSGGDEKKSGKGSASSSGSGGTTTTTTTTSKGGIPIIKAGTILFATLDTAVNSDYPDTPVLATIISGKYRGAKVLGKLSLGPNQDRVTLNFTLMDMEDWDRGKTVTAFAIDPDTARTVLASSVDYHYLLRYGSMMGNAFVSGYANAISQSGSTTTTGIFGTSTTHPELSATNKLAVGLGQVGTSLGTAMASYFNTPPTVKVNAGVGLGILFMSDVTA